MDPISIATAVEALIVLAEKLIARGKQTGELSDADAASLQAKAKAAFDKYAHPAPPPGGVTP